MTAITQYFDAEWAYALGWTLLNSLWQGLLIVFLLMIALFFLRKQKAAVRYWAGVGAMALFLIVNVFTFYSYTSSDASTILKKNSSVLLTETPIELAPSIPNIVASTGPSTPRWQETALGFFDHYMPVLVLLWLIGMMLLSLRFLGELTIIQYLRHRHVQPVSDHWNEQVKRFANQLGLRKNVSLLQSLRIDSPMVVGIFEPVILVPLGMLSNLPPEQVKSILAHELAHVKRHDYLINLLQSLAEVLFFFNPAVWWLSSYIRAEREHCCDDLAIELTGDELNFVKSLAQLEMQRADYSSLAMAWLGNSPGSVLSRIQRVVHQNRQWQLPYRIFSCIGALCLFILCLAFAQPQSTPQRIEEPPAMHPSLEAPLQDIPEAVVVTEPKLQGKQEIAEPSAETTATPLAEIEPQEEPTLITEREAASIIEVEPALLIVNDSTPQKAQVIQQQIRELQSLYQQKMMAFKEKAMAIQQRAHAHEKTTRELEMAFRQKEMQLKNQARELQQLQRQQNNELQKHELQRRKQMIELQEKAHQLRAKQQQLEAMEEVDSQTKLQLKELEQAAQELERQSDALELEHEKRELNVQKEWLNFEQQQQELERQRELMEQELEQKIYQKELEEIEFEEIENQLQFEQEKLEAELQLKMEKLAMELQKIAQQMEEHEDDESENEY